MTARILSQHGNVIAADFRPRRCSEELKVGSQTDVLCDIDHFLITHTPGPFADHPGEVVHIAFNPFQL